METLTSLFLKSVKKSMKQRQYKLSITNIEQYLLKNPDLDGDCFKNLICIFALETKAIEKLFHRYSYSKKAQHRRYIDIFMLILHRNLNFLKDIMESCISNKLMIVDTQKRNQLSMPVELFGKKQWNIFLKCLFTVCKLMALKFQIQGHYYLRQQVILEAAQVIYKTKEMKKKSSHKYLQFQILILFGSGLKEYENYDDALSIYQNILIRLATQGKLFLHKDIEGKGNKKKECWMKLFMILILSLIQLHILANSLKPVFILQVLFNRMMKITFLKRMLKTIIYLNYQTEEMVSQYQDYHPELVSIIKLICPSVSKYCEKFETSQKKEISSQQHLDFVHRQKRIIHKQIYELVFQTYGDTVASNFLQNSTYQTAKTIQNKKSLKNCLEQPLEQDLRRNIHVFNKNDQTIKRRLSTQRSEMKKNSKMIECEPKIGKKNKSEFKAPPGSEKVMLKTLRQRKKMNELKKRYQSEMSEDDNSLFKFCPKMEKVRTSIENEQKEADNIFMNPQKRNQTRLQETKALTFIKILIKNKEKLQLNSYSNRIGPFIQKYEKNTTKKRTKTKMKAIIDEVARRTYRNSLRPSMRRIVPLKTLMPMKNDEEMTEDEKRQLCYRRSFESIRELSNKIKVPETKKKLMRKSQAYFENKVLK